MLRASFCLALCLTSASALAGGHDDKTCDLTLPSGATCWIPSADLHPAQLTYGAIEVQQREDKIAAKDGDGQQKYLRKHFVTVVIGPGGFYVTDGHHVAIAYTAVAGEQAPVYAKVKANWSNLDEATFWQRMQSQNLVYLYDAQGRGPQPLTTLPAHLGGLVDDPYRSLAWGVRKNGGYDASDAPFADFKWADYFRTRVSLDAIEQDFAAAVKEGTPLAGDPAASDLPGYDPSDQKKER